MSQQPYSQELWPYPIAQDYGLGDADNGSSDIPIFMMRMMLSIRETSSGDEYAKYKYSFRKSASHYYKKGYINIMNGKVELMRSGMLYELQSRQKTHNKGVSTVTDAPEKERRFRLWIKQATTVRNDAVDPRV